MKKVCAFPPAFSQRQKERQRERAQGLFFCMLENKYPKTGQKIWGKHLEKNGWNSLGTEMRQLKLGIFIDFRRKKCFQPVTVSACSPGNVYVYCEHRIILPFVLLPCVMQARSQRLSLSKPSMQPTMKSFDMALKNYRQIIGLCCLFS